MFLLVSVTKLFVATGSIPAGDKFECVVLKQSLGKIEFLSLN